MKELTKAEEQVMRSMWGLGQCTVKDIIQTLPDPKPAYNTVSTIVRILEKKEFVDHVKIGKGYEYFPLVEQKDYTKRYLGRFMQNYFKGSFKEMVSFFAKEENMDLKEIDELMTEVKKSIDDEK